MATRTAPRNTARPGLLYSNSEDEKAVRKVIPITVYRASGYHIPVKQLSEEAIEDAFDTFMFRFYKEKNCAKCEYLPDRHSEVCDDCPSYEGAARTAKVETVNEVKYLSLPIGEKPRIIKWMKRHKYKPSAVIDKFAVEKKIKSFKLIRKPYEYQVAAVDDMIAAERGILESAPRTGKTIMGAMAVQKLRFKTLILGHQREWLDNFMTTFVGSKREPAFTDIDPKRVAFCKTVEEFKKTDIALATFQQFFSKSGTKVFREIRKIFPIVILDECHYGAAPVTIKYLAQVKSRYRFGLSGTPVRKDSREVLVDSVFGQVVHKTLAEAMRPTVVPYETGTGFQMNNRSPAAFVYFKRSMENNKARRMMIVEEAIKRAKQGHFVIIPLSLSASILTYTKMINQEAEEDWARPFDGKVKKDIRRKTIEDAKRYRFRILVANIALISTGVNIPRASCLIDGCTPSSNLPKAKQRFSRILTKMPGKPDPVIVYMMDSDDTNRSMRRNEFWNCLQKEFKPIIASEHYRQFQMYFNQKPARHLSKRDF